MARSEPGFPPTVGDREQLKAMQVALRPSANASLIHPSFSTPSRNSAS